MAALTSSIIAGAALAKSIDDTEKQKTQAKQAARDQAHEQSKLEAELKDKELLAKNQKEQAISRARQKALQGAQGGRDSTILTGPAAPAAPAVPGTKTLLGS